jgi:lipopolysaccharide transport system permease protein
MEAPVAWVRTYSPRLYQSVLHDVRQRYAGSVLGSLWAVLYPLALLTFYATIYVVVFKVRAPGLTSSGYTIMVMAGLVPIIMFTETVSMGLASVQAQKSLLLNTVFPAELLPVRAVLAGQVPSASALAITFIAAVWEGQTSPLLVLLTVPIIWVLLILFVTGLSWFLSLIVLAARDVQQAIGIVFMAVMVLSPLGYTPDMVPNGLKFILWFNPMSYFVLCFQSVLAFERFPDPVVFSAAVLISCATFAGGLYFFRRTKFVFMDYA